MEVNPLLPVLVFNIILLLENVNYVIAGETQPISVMQFNLIQNIIYANTKSPNGNYRHVHNLNDRTIHLFDS
jgi:hypothetical protein